MNQLEDEKKENDQFVREVMIRLKGETDKVQILEKEKADLTKFAFELKASMLEIQSKARKDKQVLHDNLSDLKNQRQKIDEINRMREQNVRSRKVDGSRAILPGSAAGSGNQNRQIEDYVTRLKTTSIHNEKFADTVDVLKNLLDSEEDAKERGVATSGIVTRSLMDLANFKILLKGLSSKN